MRDFEKWPALHNSPRWFWDISEHTCSRFQDISGSKGPHKIKPQTFVWIYLQSRTSGKITNQRPNATYNLISQAQWFWKGNYVVMIREQDFLKDFAGGKFLGCLMTGLSKWSITNALIFYHNLAILHPLAVGTNCKDFSPINPAQQQWLLNHVG